MKTAMVLFLFGSLSHSVLADESSLKGSSLRRQEEVEKQRQEAEAVDERSVVGGSLGGVGGGEIQEEEERSPSSGLGTSSDKNWTCEEALKNCSP